MGDLNFSAISSILAVSPTAMDMAMAGGTGSKLTRAVIIVAGVCALVASLLSAISIWFQLKNYRKPLLQRYVVRILLMVPIYAMSSWTSLVSLKAAFWVEPIRDVYEAFTIYTFFQLLINFIGGERSLIIMMHGRQPVNHLWPLNHFLGKVDISDPHTFLAIKRGILQYAWLKPALGLAAIIMKATNTYQEGYVGLKSGYFWSGIVYNVSVSLSLYSLGMFWICMSHDLQPFRPVPKFLCIKLIIFASYWQGFFLSILVWLGAIPDNVTGYTPDNIAAAIQDALICFEMPAFAIAHWYAFSWHDYADVTISAARMPVLYAFRDSFGIRDLIEDTKETFGGKGYGYRSFDSGDNVLAHEESNSRVARMMEGMRYERGGKGKYWLPKPGEATSRTPLLSDSRARAMNPAEPIRAYDGPSSPESGSVHLDEEDEHLYTNARALEFGDWNYPVITAYEPPSDLWLNQEPSLITTATNRHFLQPSRKNKELRKANIQKVIASKGKQRRGSSSSENTKTRAPILKGMLRKHSSSSSSIKSDRSQLVDLVVEDTVAEETERVRARKEGGPGWNSVEPKRFVRTYPDENQGEEIREGFNPDEAPVEDHSLTKPLDLDPSDDPNSSKADIERSHEENLWTRDEDEDKAERNVSYGSMNEERDVWSSGEGHS